MSPTLGAQSDAFWVGVMCLIPMYFSSKTRRWKAYHARYHAAISLMIKLCTEHLQPHICVVDSDDLSAGQQWLTQRWAINMLADYAIKQAGTGKLAALS